MATPLHKPRARLVALLAAALTVGLALPAAGHAAITTFGSDLKAPADLTRDRGEDTAYWSTALANGTSPKVPADGQIRVIRVKGMSIKPSGATDDPDTRIHFQTLRPRSDGTMEVILTTQMFWMPFTGDANQVTTFHPDGLCAQKGDYISFNTVGGFNPGGGYPAGTPHRIFHSVAGSKTRQYSADQGTNNGMIFPAMPTLGHPYGFNGEHDRTELLMQMELGTETDGTRHCLGGTDGLLPPAPPRVPVVRKFAGLLMPPIQAAWMSRRGVVPVRTRCPTRTPVGCSGSLTLTSKKPIASGGRKRRMKLGAAQFFVGPDKLVKVRVKLSKKAARVVRRRRSLQATLKAFSRDGGGQSNTTSGGVALKLGRR